MKKCCNKWDQFAIDSDVTFVYCPECGRNYINEMTRTVLEEELLTACKSALKYCYDLYDNEVDDLIKNPSREVLVKAIAMVEGKNNKTNPCPFCKEDFQLQVITVDLKNPERDIIKCRKCKGQAPRKFWNSTESENV